MFKDIAVSFIATLGFGIIFNIRGKNLFFAAIGGVIGWVVYELCLNTNMPTVQAFFISSIVFSTYSEICARLLKTPVTTLIVCALIPLVPGSGMYYTMYAAVTGDAEKTLSLTLSTLASAGSLALGVIFVSTITRLVTTGKHNYLKKLSFKKARLKQKK
ncbi:threonine/serine exporter family protein [Clostridium fallax]|uniref:Uncharacterized membrane protein YjjB, DUF3815 family n=1 Tax=Clostridium fallax TaxID=1533 RepID=A0A1M4ZGZ9_9CLOT|nr:threonine/serine exporter family protein [Clostridium fallax]SHF17228.1 Uncharacterized membrane protein YjjB, DUF3815 family [Clostridium fallax]SQB06192.1 membrane spanning protein [Clostridium fallax]